MRTLYILFVIACVAIALTGCSNVSRPYVMQTDRVDQKMEAGNRGYLKGTPPPAEDRSGLKRSLIAVDIDLIESNKGKIMLEEVTVKEEDIK